MNFYILANVSKDIREYQLLVAFFFFFFFFCNATAWTQICYKHWHYHCGDSYYRIELIITTEPERQWLVQGKCFPWSDLIIAMCIIYFLCTAMTIANQKINRNIFISWSGHWGFVNAFFFLKLSSNMSVRSTTGSHKKWNYDKIISVLLG